MDRYKEVLQQMLAAGVPTTATRRPELERMREEQRAKGLKPRYDGTWRPEPDEGLANAPGWRTAGRALQESDRWRCRLGRPREGRIEIANAELDDLVIARTDFHLDV